MTYQFAHQIRISYKFIHWTPLNTKLKPWLKLNRTGSVVTVRFGWRKHAFHLGLGWKLKR